MTAKIILLPEAPNELMPMKATLDSAGVDLRANLEKPLKLIKGSGQRIGTGIRLRIFPGYCCLVLPRSGLGGPPHFLTIPNAPGLIDPDYQDEVFINLFCLGAAVTIKPWDRVAQLICIPQETFQGHFGVRAEERMGGAGSTGV